MRSATLNSLAAPFCAAIAFAATGTSTRAQAADSVPRRTDDESVCLGFAFGGFTPKLDWERAGHRAIRDSSTLQRAPGGRDWATDVEMKRGDALYLFPAWWPVGVMVELPTRNPAPGDTVAGMATALVARGDVEPPVAKVRAWRVSCGAPPARPRTGSADTSKAALKRAPKNRSGTGTAPSPLGILRRSP